MQQHAGMSGMSTVKPRLDLRPDYRSIVRDVLRKHVPGREVRAFGSRATWTAKEYSDLDLAVLGNEALSLRTTSALTEGFAESDLPFKVDLIDWTRIDETFRDVIRRDGVAVQVPVNAHAAKEVKPKSASACEGWRNIPLGKIVELTLSSVDKKAKHHEEEILLCNYMDVYSQRFIRDDLSFMTATATENEIRRCGLQSGDVVITKDSEQFDDIGVPALVRDEVSNLVCGYHLAILRPLEKLISGFYLFYALQAMNVQHQFHAYANGVTRFGLRKDDILRVEVPIPPLPEQRAIGHILGTLDDKIELNRRMNKTLEAMARVIFKDWFVDFGPTQAKAEGRAPYLAPEYWDLFPDALDRDGKPVGWRTGILSDVADSQRRSVGPTDVAENTPYIGLKHMPRRSIALTEWEGAGKVRSNKSVFKQGEFLFGKLSPCFHKVGFAPLDGICSTDIVIVIPRDPDWAAFTLGCLSSDEFVEYTDRTSTGTIMSRTSWKTMGKYKICLPSEQVAQVFQNMVQPLLERVNENIHESHALAQTCDILLPKLISGELRVDEADTVKAATQ